MQTYGLFGVLLVTSALVLSGCTISTGSGDGDGGGGREKPAPAQRLNWAAVPADFHPETKDISFQTEGFAKINIATFDSSRDVEIVYSPTVTAGSSFLRVFSVWSKSASFGTLGSSPSGATLTIQSTGTYQCLIQIRNRQITRLEGGCYVRQQLFLPVGSEIEVYNGGRLLSKRFIAMTVETFLQQLDDAISTSDKMKVVDDFLGSYSSLGKTAKLAAAQLGKALREFAFQNEKLTALRRLHSFVSDRENLGQMIDTEFGTFDREEARRTVGL
jgi:hypothetical protein